VDGAFSAPSTRDQELGVHVRLELMRNKWNFLRAVCGHEATSPKPNHTAPSGPARTVHKGWRAAGLQGLGLGQLAGVEVGVG
jgi:hypothetical protein